MTFEQLSPEMQAVIVEINVQLNAREIPSSNVTGMNVPVLKHFRCDGSDLVISSSAYQIAEFRLERRISPTQGRFIFEQLREK